MGRIPVKYSELQLMAIKVALLSCCLYDMNTEYVLQVINLHRTILRENKVGSAIPHLNKKLFKAIEVPIPPYKEQQRIVEAANKVFMSLDVIMGSL